LVPEGALLFSVVMAPANALASLSLETALADAAGPFDSDSFEAWVEDSEWQATASKHVATMRERDFV